MTSTAEIIQFPIDRQLYFVRETARALERKHGDAADRFWKLTCRRLYARLQVQGMANAEINGEIEAFSKAVHLEMQRAAWAAWEARNPKGVA
ncbi:hypothetical protein IB270_07655 [Ensifer sp. ENS05]|uniref:DUF6074 family protein n=1 Tax=Ensifer sp. ENS05 TaxID=2769277 RepID=UPI001781CE1F|nr:DUF6074 family protein [Ensifer sp. ENS05]MBD9592704.1 hypothetical protein [Ensifer sp. ENS05]